MAFYSHQCVNCTESTKKCAGEYHGNDETGKPFAGSLYTCENPTYKIGYERKKTERYLHTADSSCYPPDGEERYRRKFR